MTLTMHQMVDEVRAALADKLRVRGRSLAVQVRKAGRRLPRAVMRSIWCKRLAWSITPSEHG